MLRHLKSSWIALSAVAVALVALPTVVLAWSHLSTENDLVADPGPGGVLGSFIRSLPDGAGGFYTVWTVHPGAANESVFVKRFAEAGYDLWPGGAISIYTATVSIRTLDAVVDAGGNLYVGFTDGVVGGNNDVYAQKVLATGSLPWTTSARRLDPSVTGVDENSVRLVADDLGGCVATWVDGRNLMTSNTDIYAQRVASNGTLLWGSGGLAVCTATFVQTYPVIARSDDGVIIGWVDQRSGTNSDIYADELDLNGVSRWSANGLGICTNAATQGSLSMVSDGAGGVLMAWVDMRSFAVSDADIYGVRLRGDGSFAWPTSGGTPICTATGPQSEPTIRSDGVGGAYVGWLDERPTDAYSAGVYYVTRLYSAGTPRWPVDGLLCGGANGGQFGLTMAVDAAGRLGLAWSDARNVYSDIYGQLFQTDGSQLWGYSGAALCDAAEAQQGASAFLDSRGGLVVSFQDYRLYTRSQLRMQRMDASGYLGDPAPIALSAVDAPQDQGGVVLLDWERSWLDNDVNNFTGTYSVWNRYAGAKALADGAAAARRQETAAVVTATGLPADEVATRLLAGWTFLGNVPAQHFETYGFNAATYADSTAAGVPLTEFQIVAQGNSGQFWHSNIVSGYSVDNLAPGAPLHLAAVRSGVDVDLGWTRGGAAVADLGGFRVYRSATPGFTPGPGNLVGTSTDTLHTDVAPPAGARYYRVSAVDVHGNEGPPSNEAAISGATGVNDGGGLPAVFALRGAVPNPFNPSTLIRFDLPRDGRVTVGIYDARGACVRTLRDEVMIAGRHDLRWDGAADDGRALPSGVYLVRATGEGVDATMKMVLAR